ncbi:MAG TPA: ATP-grasp domain-containing protein [Streptosporangiaceae bacterium]|nr:ATP-grasp domain-containing protein [Streptosporangiaceae bacterium]
MPPPPRSIILVNATKVYPPRLLTALSSEATVSVITLPEYAGRYPDVARLELVSSLYDFGGVTRAAMEVAREHGVDHVIGPAEMSVPAAGLLRSYFGIPGTGFETALSFSNKHLMKQRLRAAGLPVTDWVSVPSVERVPGTLSELGAPVVVKPVFGGGGQHTFVLKSAADAAALATSPHAAGLREAGCPVIVERFVEIINEYHCDGVVHDGEVRFAAVSRYFAPLLGQIGSVSGSHIVAAADPVSGHVTDLHRSTVAALGLRSGVTHMELFETSCGFLVGEITCRPAGGGVPEVVLRQYGVDLWQAFTDTSLGRTPSAATDPATSTFAWVDMPIRPGRVAELSSAEELATLPGVVEVEMHAAVGDVIGTHMHTSTTTARLYVSLDDVADLDQRLGDLSAAFRLEVEPMRAAVAHA